MGLPVVIEQEQAIEVVVFPPSPKPLRNLGTNLVTVAATGAGPSVYTADKGYCLWVVRVTAVTTGGTVLIQGCEKDSITSTDWYTIATVLVAATGTQYVAVLANERHMFQRSNVTVRTDGTYSTILLAEDRFPL